MTWIHNSPDALSTAGGLMYPFTASTTFPAIDPPVLIAGVLTTSILTYLLWRSRNRVALQRVVDCGIPLAVAIFGMLCKIFETFFRKLRDLPYIITGTSPMACRLDGKLTSTPYSRIKISVFGWASLSVVAYVGLASRNIANAFAQSPDDSTLFSIVTAAVMSTIVFHCDRFILAYPSVCYVVDIDKTLQENTPAIIERCPGSRWFLNTIRLGLALCISMLLATTTMLQFNTNRIRQEVVRANQATTHNQLAAHPDFITYGTAYSNYERAIRNERAAAICEDMARTGKIPETPILHGTDAVPDTSRLFISANPSDTNAGASYQCVLTSSRPCLSSDEGRCPEMTRHRRAKEAYRKQAQLLKQEVENATPALLQAEKAIRERAPTAQSMGDAIAGLASLYATMWTQKEMREQLIGESIFIIPLMLILIAFELLPAIAKIIFPPSAHDRLMALMELRTSLAYDPTIHEQLKRTVRADLTTPDHTGESLYMQMERLDTLQKGREAELGTQLVAMLNALLEFVRAVCSIGWASTLMVIMLGFVLLEPWLWQIITAHMPLLP